MSTTLQDVLDECPIAMVTTMVGRQMSARPVACADVGPASVTFLVHRDADWVKHVEGREAIVHVTVADDERRCWVSLDGTASTSHDADLIGRLWDQDLHGAYFAVDDPDAVLVRFDVTGGEYWSDTGRTGTPLTLPAQPEAERSRTAQ